MVNHDNEHVSVYLERAENKGVQAALEDLVTGNDRSGEDVIADTEVLVFEVTGKKLYELEDNDEDIVIAIIEAHDEKYVETYSAGRRITDE